jgi:hypothetical protein
MPYQIASLLHYEELGVHPQIAGFCSDISSGEIEFLLQGNKTWV